MSTVFGEVAALYDAVRPEHPPELAGLMDARVDGSMDAQFGRLREQGQHNGTSMVPDESRPWSSDELGLTYDGDDPDGDPDEGGQVVPLNGYLKMTQ